jgi:proteic killer suppression protein
MVDVTRKFQHLLYVIQSFACKDTAALFQGIKCHSRFRDRFGTWPSASFAAGRGLADLRIPPQNKLKALSKDRQGQHAIRINDQYRLCFVWTAQGPADVELVDYH